MAHANTYTLEGRSSQNTDLPTAETSKFDFRNRTLPQDAKTLPDLRIQPTGKESSA